MQYKVYARRLDNGHTEPDTSAPLYNNFEEAREAARTFMLKKMDETGTGWMWHLDEIED